MRLLYFLAIASVLGTLYRVKLSARRHASSMPGVHKSGRSTGLAHLHYPAEVHVAVHDFAALLASTCHAITRMPRVGLSPTCHVVRSIGLFVSRVRFTFALVRGNYGSWTHGINYSDYSAPKNVY